MSSLERSGGREIVGNNKMQPPAELTAYIRANDCFIIVPHINPDGDALGSAISLCMVLKNMGKDATVLIKGDVSDPYGFLPGLDLVDGSHSFFSKKKSYPNLILVDCNALERTGLDASEISMIGFKHCIVIDHHVSEGTYGEIRWVVSEAPATGILITYLIKSMHQEITRDIAVNLYSAIAMDTGNFSYENTSSDALAIAAELTGFGAVPHDLYGRLFESWSTGRFELFLMTMNSMLKQKEVVIVKVTKEMFEKTSTSPDDTEHFVEFPRVMADVKITVIFRELDKDYFKVSLRSKGDMNVAKVAEKFGGGGHRNAAGFRIRTDFESGKNELLSKLSAEFKDRLAL